ncbi:MAG: NAD(P)-dependent oxidoreductase [Gemmatimonadota bacterium]|nr:NAD(P)-dependent oxidoreductase [Gemmatimonadota bacterium]
MGKKKIFLTGAAGSLGTSIRSRMRARYDFRLLLHSTVPDDVHSDDQVVFGSVADHAAMVEAMSGVDAVVHLAIRRWSGMTAEDVAKATLEVDNPGVYNILEAARITAVPVVVFASTNHVTGLYEKEGLVSTPESPVRPDGVYGAGKAFGEALGRFYAERYGIRVICLRVANFNGKDAPGTRYEAGYSRWLSPRDLAQLVWRSVEAEHVDFGIFYGVSGGSEKKWDLSNARELLGYIPEDDGSLPEYG